MKILYFGNNWVGLKVLEWLKKSGEEICGLVVHPKERQKFGKEMIEVSGLSEDKIFDGSKLRKEETLDRIRKLNPDIGLSIFFGYILKAPLLETFPKSCLNLHPALLPFNRGSYPNVWSIIENTAAGATLHYVDVGIDTGDILAKKEIEVEAFDTGESLYKKLEIACIDLFKESWSDFKNGILEPLPQSSEEGTHHRIKEVKKLDEIDLDKEYKARDLINILRARTFPPYRGAYFRDEKGRKIYLELNLELEKDVE